METLRKPFQGVRNIIRFNWHFYLLAVIIGLVLGTLYSLGSSPWADYSLWALIFLAATLISSLAVSTYVYDLSGLYSLNWIDRLKLGPLGTLVNVHAGFDETSRLLQWKYPRAECHILDFYTPEKHTEVSIKRARKAYPPHEDTLKISPEAIPLTAHSVHAIFALLTAHEIRNDAERVLFFKELARILTPGGKIVVLEHLRDMPNFLAYTLGFFHFHSKRTWMRTFTRANLQISQEIKKTPFLTLFVLEHA